MELLLFLLDLLLNIDQHLQAFVGQHGAWVYALLFLIVFVETGVVVTPFLPGDSLLFLVGALGGAGLIDIGIAILVLLAAAILGDQTNYLIGRRLGPKVFGWEQSRWFNRRAFDRAHAFYHRYGGLTIVLARFIPFLRTFVPFVAGIAEMERIRFSAFNILGALLWVQGLCLSGYFFGDLPWVKENLEKVIWSLILLPGLIALAGAWKSSRQPAA